MSLAIIIPIQRRHYGMLAKFVAKMPDIEADFFVVEQMNDGEFNKGALFNAGVREAGAYDHYCFHDPILPIEASYEAKGNIIHLYDYMPRKTYFGGALIIPAKQLKTVGGFCNTRIGLELDEMRIQLYKIKWGRKKLIERKCVFEEQPKEYFSEKAVADKLKISRSALDGIYATKYLIKFFSDKKTYKHIGVTLK